MATALSRQLTAARRQYQLLSAHPALQSPVGYLEQRRKSLELLKNRLIAAQTHQISNQKARYIAMTAKLDAMSPLKVLTRGYAMAQTEEGDVLRSVNQVNAGEQIKITVSDGTLSAAVTDVKENGR
jgi:exodeoxyribonuclease VII large subunit